MLTLSSIKASPRRPGRYLLSLSDGRELLVGVAVLADTGVTREGVTLDDLQVERLIYEHVVTALVDRGLDTLARGRRTRRELEIRLGKREATADQIRAALDRLEASGLLSDEQVAEAEAASRLRRGEAPAQVRQRLRRKGVEGPVANAAVADAIRDDGFDEVAACRAQAAKRARTLRNEEPAAAQRKLLGFLVRRGYAIGIARRVCREVLGPSVAADGDFENA